MSSREKKAARKAEREQRLEKRRLEGGMSPRQENRGPLRRWRCASRCGAGEWTSRLDIPERCPNCGAGIDIEERY